MIHICRRCKYNTNSISSLRKHLKRLSPCIITYLNISREDLLNEIPLKNFELNEKTYDCNKCNRKFNSSGNKSKHQKNCTVVEITLEQKVRKMEEEILLLKSALTTTNINNITNTNTTNTTNNTTNNVTNNLNITLNIYHNGDSSKYDTSTIDFNEVFSKLMGDNSNGIIPFLKMKYFNPDHPENHIIRINDKKLMESGNLYIHTGDNAWELESSTKVYNDLNNEAAIGLLDTMNSGKSIARKHIPVDNYGTVYNELWGRDKQNPKDVVVNGINNLLVNNINDQISVT